MTTEQTTALGTAITDMSGAVLGDFISLLPAMAAAVGIAFVLYKVAKLVKGLGKGKVRA